MSYSFYVRTLKAPAINELIQQIDRTDLLIVNENNISKWPKASLTICRRFRSTRGIHLSFAEDRIEIKTNVFCSPDDYQLALELVVAASQITGSLPRGEFSAPMPLDQLLADHNGKWINESHASALRTFKTLIKDSGTMATPGPFRSCYIGQNILEQIGQDDNAAIEDILTLMQRVQWIHSAGYETASDMTIGNADQPLAIWFPAKRMFLPKVDWIAIGEVEPIPIFPFGRLGDVLGRPLTLIDECQPLIEPTQPEDMPALIARARQFHTSPAIEVAKAASAAASSPNIKKPWWKVW